MTTKNSNYTQQILAGEIVMDAQMKFHANGDINIYPCPWENDKEVTNEPRVRYRGGIEVDADGRTRVKRYKDGSKGPIHDTLFETAHGAVKMTRPIYRKKASGTHKAGERQMDSESVYIIFKFPKKYGLALTKALYQEETDEIMSYLKTRKEETIWK